MGLLSQESQDGLLLIDFAYGSLRNPLVCLRRLRFTQSAYGAFDGARAQNDCSCFLTLYSTRSQTRAYGATLGLKMLTVAYERHAFAYSNLLCANQCLAYSLGVLASAHMRIKTLKDTTCCEGFWAERAERPWVTRSERKRNRQI